MVAAFNTIANDGMSVPLQMVREITQGDGTRQVPAPPEAERIVSSQTATQISAMLENAVAVGTGKNAQVDGYRVAGKTGTARKALDNEAGYEDGAGNYRYVASFAGYLPANKPELSIIVTIDEPTATIYAGEAAAPAFAEIATFAVRHLRIAPPVPAAAATRTDVPARLETRVTGVAAESPDDLVPADLDPGEPAADGVSASAIGAGVAPVTAAPESTSVTDPAPDDDSDQPLAAFETGLSAGFAPAFEG